MQQVTVQQLLTTHHSLVLLLSLLLLMLQYVLSEVMGTCELTGICCI